MLFTTGWLILGIGIAGLIACVAGLAATGPVFKRQRKKLLERIERN